jgi:hypothetical protein
MGEKLALPQNEQPISHPTVSQKYVYKGYSMDKMLIHQNV